MEEPLWDQSFWQSDPRLAGMDPEKLNFITAFARQISTLPHEHILPAFMAMQLDASRKHIDFSDQETEALVSILSENMSNAEKELETLRLLAKKLAARSS